MVGKFSYAGVMQERFLKELPYSGISQIIRQSKGMPEIEIPPSTGKLFNNSFKNAEYKDPLSSRNVEANKKKSHDFRTK